MPFVVTSAHMRRVRALAFAAPLFVASARAFAQRPTKDSTRTDSSRAQQLERVMISAVRASGAAPISEKTLGTEELPKRAVQSGDRDVIL